MEGLKQRVIGALVLISLAVIFIPMLFDEPHEERVSKILPIPEKPALPSITIEEPKPVGLDVSAVNPLPGIDQEPLDVVSDVSSEQKAPAIVEKPVVQAPVKTESVSKAADAESMSSEIVKISAPAKSSKEPALDEAGLASAWTVQIGTFKSRDNAYRLRDKVRDQGFKGYTREINTEGGELVRVFAGPVRTNDDAQRLKEQLEKALGMKTLVVRYAP